MGRPFGIGLGSPITKESQLRQRSKTLSSYADRDKASHNYDTASLNFTIDIYDLRLVNVTFYVIPLLV